MIAERPALEAKEPSVALTVCSGCGLPMSSGWPQADGALVCSLCDAARLNPVTFARWLQPPRTSRKRRVKTA